MKVSLTYDNPIPAPIKKGEKLALLKVKIPNQKIIKIELVAGNSVDQLGFFGRVLALFTSVIWGASG